MANRANNREWRTPRIPDWVSSVACSENVGGSVSVRLTSLRQGYGGPP